MTHRAQEAQVQALLSWVSEPARAVLAAEPDLGAWLGAAVDDARDRWPTFALSAEEFVRYLASKLDLVDAARTFRTLHVTELYLACACANGDPKALAEFEALYFSQVDRALRRMKIAPSLAPELKAAMREKLFVAAAGVSPLITDYAGRGDLGSWIRSIAVRSALKALRGSEKTSGLDEAVLELPVNQLGPELDYLKTLYASEFKTALSSAFESLSPRERNLLRQQVLDGLSIDDIGTLYRVHRATAARWLVDIRAKLLHAARGALRERLRVTDSEFESLVRFVQSQLDVSVRRLLLEGSP